MRKLELLPTRDGEAGYGPDSIIRGSYIFLEVGKVIKGTVIYGKPSSVLSSTLHLK